MKQLNFMDFFENPFNYYFDDYFKKTVYNKDYCNAILKKEVIDKKIIKNNLNISYKWRLPLLYETINRFKKDGNKKILKYFKKELKGIKKEKFI